jgi:hypothetical protein
LHLGNQKNSPRTTHRKTFLHFSFAQLFKPLFAALRKRKSERRREKEKYVLMQSGSVFQLLELKALKIVFDLQEIFV